MLDWIGRILASDVFRGGALFTAAVTGLFAVAMQFLRNRPRMVELEDLRAKTLRDEKRTDEKVITDKVAGLEARLDKTESTVHRLEMKLVGAISAYRVLDVHVSETDPEAPALKQARALMSVAFTLSPSTEADIDSRLQNELLRMLDAEGRNSLNART